MQFYFLPCVPICILSTLSALNSIENYYYHIEFMMDSMHIGTQAFSPLCQGSEVMFRVSRMFLWAVKAIRCTVCGVKGCVQRPECVSLQ